MAQKGYGGKSGSRWAEENYSWIIVGSVLVMQTVSSGIGFYNMSVYIKTFSDLLSVSLAEVSVAASLFYLTGGIAGLYVAALMDRFPVRVLVFGGALLSSLALALMGLARSLLELYCLFSLFGVGSAGISIVVSTTLITRWFEGPDRSMALAVSSTGLSLGGFIWTPLTAYWINDLGALEAMWILAMLLLIIVLPIGFILKFPDLKKSQLISEPTDDQDLREDLSLEAAYRSRFYVLIVIAYIFIMCSQVGAIAHLYNRVDLVAGYDYAAQSIQALSVASILGRFFGGWLVNKISTSSFALGNLILQGLGLLLISLADSGAFSIFAALVFGLSVGNLLMTLPLWLAEVFPAGVYPKLFARANAFSVLGLAVGPFTIGALFDLTDGYHIPYLFALFVSLLAFFVMLAAVKQKPAISR
tara:strand:+ start:13367 stop:14614 length:1248 start_codon:yes stop_codon:yes gene_type:complete